MYNNNKAQQSKNRVHISWDILYKRACRTILNTAESRWVEVFQGAPVDKLVTKVPVASCRQGMRLMVARARPTRPAILLCHMRSWSSASTACLIRIENDHLSCGLDFNDLHLELKWKSGQGKVKFLWGAVTCTYHVNFSPLEAQKFDPYRFHWLKWGWNNLLFQECI